jgi:hypothetical protein
MTGGRGASRNDRANAFVRRTNTENEANASAGGAALNGGVSHFFHLYLQNKKDDK